ncbi:Phosphoribulokinase/uridine kinase family protein [Alteracholeplasma palmae J233]|uniref:Phosphoribulokinase/uridine kinase family protein n=1 Tax=Alteracholeplasma palmae (strain ATCC 49389 / J233) TaxID=1318466 RepID=U4KQH3_ALTPJ|nr:nucleoside kinase [Alteracholeplasma palmae]CCV64585.1 Phosphoribulokinase/uridine kinase family protein [Alteracholeplasma palmae J233]
MKINVLNQVLEVKKGDTLEEIAKQAKITDAVVATVDGRLRELTYKLEKDNSNVEFLNLSNTDAVRVYEASLRYLFAMATYNLYPEIKLRFNYSISRSILAVFEGYENVPEEKLENIINEVNRLVSLDLEIKRVKTTKDKAIEIYEKLNLKDKIDILKYREENNVNLYQTADYMNYMYSYMVPKTGHLKKFKAFNYHPGFIIQFPRTEFQGNIPPFVDAPTFGKALRNVAKWGKIIGGNTIDNINRYTETRDSQVDFVNLCETKLNNQLSELGKRIEENKEDIRLIAVAGPSSSGKTTFTNRLRIELLSLGIRPVMISMDDYYFRKEDAPKDKDGKPDLEHVEALDIELFNKDMLSLIQGNAVTLPKFNFHTGKREAGKTIKVDKNSPILIEGIHALNDRLTSLIPKHQKFRIYISPQTQLHIDNHNPISITDLRLLRRAVRDQKYRNSPVTSTMDMWPSVRRGEFKWIYPYQEEADFVFNSELTYEISVLKQFAMPHLLAIPAEDRHYITANRLVKFLKYFREIDPELVPNNSILKEFIGGSPFHD